MGAGDGLNVCVGLISGGLLSYPSQLAFGAGAIGAVRDGSPVGFSTKRGVNQHRSAEAAPSLPLLGNKTFLNGPSLATLNVPGTQKGIVGRFIDSEKAPLQGG
jgi:hypothetical protein